jgi:hypothetical protein
MCAAIAYARALDYVVDVETNAFWARTEEMARSRLSPFVAAGVAGVSLSADAYHVRYFPVDRVINAARAARSFGLLTEVNFCPSSDLATDAEILATLTAASEPFLRNELLDRGRGNELISLGQRRRVDELPDCDSLTTTVHATGDIYACCELDISTEAMKRTPVFLGSIQSGPHQASTEPHSARDDREHLVTAFYDPESPIYFQRLVRDHAMFRGLSAERFSNICDFCMRALGDPGRVAALSAMLAAAE